MKMEVVDVRQSRGQLVVGFTTLKITNNPLPQSQHNDRERRLLTQETFLAGLSHLLDLLGIVEATPDLASFRHRL